MTSQIMKISKSELRKYKNLPYQNEVLKAFFMHAEDCFMDEWINDILFKGDVTSGKILSTLRKLELFNMNQITEIVLEFSEKKNNDSSEDSSEDEESDDDDDESTEESDDETSEE
jgi:hypothetical protein